MVSFTGRTATITMQVDGSLVRIIKMTGAPPLNSSQPEDLTYLFHNYGLGPKRHKIVTVAKDSTGRSFTDTCSIDLEW